MIILEDSAWEKLKNYTSSVVKELGRRTRQGFSDKYGAGSFARRISGLTTDQDKEKIKASKIEDKLSSKSNLRYSLDAWINALMKYTNPTNSELYDFLMNSKSNFRRDNALIIADLFEKYNLKAEDAIESSILDDPEYTERLGVEAELIKSAKDTKKNTSMKPYIFIYRMLFDMTEDKAKKEIKASSDKKIEDKIIDFWSNYKGWSVGGKLTKKEIETLKSSTEAFAPPEQVIEWTKDKTITKNDLIVGWADIIITALGRK